MKRLFTNLFLVALVIAPGSLFSQNCRNIVKYCDHAKRDGFLRNGQSLSGAFAQGDTAEITVIVYKDMEYRMSLCSPTHDELDGKFEFKIVEQITKPYWDEEKVSEVEEVTKLDENGDEMYDDEGYPMVEEVATIKVIKKRRYKKVDVVRYDNKKDEDAQEFVFISDKTRKLTIKVYIPLPEGGDEGQGLGAETYACVGLLIEHQPGPTIGFNR
jgi:hypothetical protein